MKIVFRADASERIGTGHVMRCLTLAHALRARGADIHFICRAHPGHLIDFIKEQKISVAALPAPPAMGMARDGDYAAWLGVSQEDDARQTIEAFGGNSPDWVVVDHYGINQKWEEALSHRALRLMVIDDLANRPHNGSIILNQNYTDRGDALYENSVPAECQKLMGPRYALLRSEFESIRQKRPAHNGHVSRVLVFLGGSDLYNVTGRVVEALSDPALSHLETDVVVGVNNPHRMTIEKQAAARPRTNFHSGHPRLIDLMAVADLAVGAGGGTTWERMGLGVPTVLGAIADNQKPASEALARADLVDYLPDINEATSSEIAGFLKMALSRPEKLVERSRRGRLLVDGRGTARVCEAIWPMPAADLRVRPAHADDIDLYFNWVNDAAVRRQAIHPEPVEWETHQKWFAQKIADKNSSLFVLMAGELPVGQVRFDRTGDEAVIDYSLDPAVRGRGWASRLIALGTAALSDRGRILLRAEVKPDNVPSCAVFRRLGFDEIGPTTGGLRVFRARASRV